MKKVKKDIEMKKCLYGLIFLLMSFSSLYAMKRIAPLMVRGNGRLASTVIRYTYYPNNVRYCSSSSCSIFSEAEPLIVDSKQKSIKDMERKFTQLYWYTDLPLYEACTNMQRIRLHLNWKRYAQMANNNEEEAQRLERVSQNLGESINTIKMDPRWLKYVEIKALQRSNELQEESNSLIRESLFNPKKKMGNK